MKRWLVVVLLAAIAVPVAAQPAPAPGPDRTAERREKIKQRIRALRAYTLTEQLALDEQTAGKLFPMLAKFDEEFDKLLQQRADLQHRLQAAGGIKDPKAVDKLIDEAVANQRALWDTEDKRLAQLRKILTPAQTARVLIVLPAMERKIQNQLRKAVQRQKAQQGPVDPYGDDEGVDPFAPEPPAAKQPKRPPGAAPPCDPFDAKHGCGK
ncbi:MAG TPA: hypothetical protein VIV40_04715 [Kofleriaceae bacterium]